MAYTTINKGTDYFNTKLYTGNSSTQSITGVGFQPDWVWIKERSGSEHHSLYDAVRGATKEIASNRTNVESTVSTSLTGFDSDGFTLGSWSRTNNNNDTHVSWNWKANGAGSSNTDGNITSTVSASTTSGFSIVKWTGTGSNPSTVGHGLGAVPKMIITKRISGDTASWHTYHASIGNAHDIYLNGTNSQASDTSWNSTTPTSSVFTINGANVNVSAAPYIAYCFAEKTGYSKFGSYQGIANNDGVFVYTGFAPKFIMVKASTNTGTYSSWSMFDTARSVNENVGKTLYANKDYPEGNRGNGDSSTTSPAVDLLSNGFKFRKYADETNAPNTTYIYMAFGQSLVGSNGVTAKAR